MGKAIGPDFVALQVRDPDASERFYTERLGLEVDLEGMPGAVVFRAEPIPFAVREPSVDLDAVEKLGWGVALWMRCEDADGLCRSLRSSGAEIAQEPSDSSFGRTFAFVDPDGYTVTVHDG